MGKKLKAILKEQRMGITNENRPIHELKQVLFSFWTYFSHRKYISLRDRTVSCVSYKMDELLFDLLDFAAQRLELGGRLVYWLPTTSEYYFHYSNFALSFFWI